MIVVVALVLISLAFGSEDILKGLEELKKKGIIPESQMERIEEYQRKNKSLIEKKKREVLEGLANEGRDRDTKTVKSDKVIYLFISSSVPLEVWWNYAHQALNGNHRVVFVLRGCIGGCRYIKPTLEFIQKFLTEDGQRERWLPIEVQIDPLKFRKYGVKKVPCFALEGEEVLSCGDYTLEYHLRRLLGG